MKNSPAPSVALVYDRVNTAYGGAENVLLALHQLFPQAPLFTSLYSSRAHWAKDFTVITSPLNNIPILRHLHRWLAVLMPISFESLDLSQYDIIISVTSAEAKGVLTNSDQLHLCYLLTPPRYVYHQQQHSLDSHWFLRLPIIRSIASLLLSYLRWWDQVAIFRPDVIIPISKRITNRVKEFYPTVEPAEVLYPPIDIKHRLGEQEPIIDQPYLLTISRLVSHKRIELVIKACAKLNRKLVIIGEGPERKTLRKLAKSLQVNVIFFRSVTDQQLTSLYQHCQALIMPGEEDFGLVALEANSFGKPVIINAKSGAAELIKPGVDGIHLEKETVSATMKAIEDLDKKEFSTSKIKQNPVKYSTEKFLESFSAIVEKLWQAKQKDLK